MFCLRVCEAELWFVPLSKYRSESRSKADSLLQTLRFFDFPYHPWCCKPNVSAGCACAGTLREGRGIPVCYRAVVRDDQEIIMWLYCEYQFNREFLKSVLMSHLCQDLHFHNIALNLSSLDWWYFTKLPRNDKEMYCTICEFVVRFWDIISGIVINYHQPLFFLN